MIDTLKLCSFAISLLSILNQGIITGLVFSKHVETPSLEKIVKVELAIVAPLVLLALALALQAFLLSKTSNK